MKLVSYLVRITILIASITVFAYGPLPIGLKAICITVILAGWLNTTDY